MIPGLLKSKQSIEFFGYNPMTDEELKALVASLAVAQKETDEQMKRTDEQLKRTDAKLERIGISLGNVTNN